ncbi:probable RNA-directed DNA polymerase from transposon X-element [Trichonephila clavipes]|nr:probable RNA-directed DNA polymerase from transposon X-element [Trichonephila clavipes]
MKTRCLKCGGGHRTGQCEIKEKILNPTCINCNAEGHMASSTSPSRERRAARESDSSTSNSENKNKNKRFNSETLNHINCQGGDFSFLQAIFEMKKIFDLFPNLISEMKKSSNCTDPTDKLQCLLKGVEATLVALTPSDQEPFLVASIYAPPNPNYRNLGADLDGIFKIFKSAFLAGDYNAKHTSWGCNYSDPRGNYLLRYITNNNLDLIAAPTPTRYGTDSASTLDYALIKHLIWPCIADSIPELSVLTIIRQQAWEDNLSTLNAEDNSLWGIAKAFRKKTSPISALNGPTGIALSDTNKTEVIAHSLEKQFHLNDIHNPRKDEIITSVVDAYMDSNINNTDIIPPTLPSEIIQIIKKIKIKKCPGRDGITNKMLKKLPRLTIFKITNIINNMLTLRYFLISWKTAVVIPILKPGKNSALAESYRPISLLPVLSKLAEKVILARLNDHLERENILIPEQHGFRPRLSTSHQLLRVVEFIKEGNNKDECTAVVFLDIQKAFDRVWHTGLLFKLITYKIPPPLIYLLNSYISDRSFTVKINRTFSQLKKINAGVAQGSILAPTLFILYVNDITKNSNTIICMYADDTAILSRHRNLDTLVENINEHLAHLETWFSVWKIALNSSKKEAVFFSKRKPPPEITLQNQRIPWSQHTKYLGVIVDKNLTFSDNT